jgi:lycopene beta-cyclase
MSLTIDHPEKPVISIIGFGAAGMLCLRSLLQSEISETYRFQIFEPDSKNENDRTWCFWVNKNDAILQQLGSIIHRSWESIYVDNSHQTLSPLVYVQINSRDFYAFVKELLVRYDHISWIKEPVNDVFESDGIHTITTDEGLYRSNIVLDSRIEAFESKEGQLLLQSFYGWKVKILEDTIDARSVQLMNFEIAQDGGCQFVYVLPDSDQTALVEVTRFGVDLIQKDRSEIIMDEWIKSHWGEYEILEVEHGVIPMTQSLDNISENKSSSYCKIGTAGGAVKSSTGFAFHTMYQHAESLTKAIQSKSAIPEIRRKRRFQFYDSLLIYILIHFPTQGKSIFEALFRRVKPAVILQFLSEKTSLFKEIPLLLKLPYRPFFKALFDVYILIPLKSIRLRGLMRYEFSLLLFMLIFALLYPHYPVEIQYLGYGLLIVGMLFPGIPHGALDHHLEGHLKPTGALFWQFIFKYLAVMGLVLLIWWVAPSIGLAAFLLYSAWHFGETDARQLEAYSPITVMIYGFSLLLFLLASHPVESSHYFEQLGVFGWSAPIIAYSNPMMLISGIAILMVFWRKRVNRLQGIILIGILLIATQLPLVIAFGFYFIGYHSVRAWKDIRRGLKTSSLQLFKFALPYSLGAYGFFFVAWYWLGLSADTVQDWIPALFVFLAAISAPHIFMMHRFYEKLGIGQGVSK